MFSKIVRFGELRRDGPLLLPLLADDNLLAILRGQRQEIVIGLHKIRREEIEPVEPVVKMADFLVRIIMGIDVQSGASDLSQGYVMFFHVSCVGLSGQ